MNIKDFEKAKKHYDTIRELDTKINHLDKMAQSVAEGNLDCKMALTFKSNLPEEEKENIFSRDGSLSKYNTGDVHRTAGLWGFLMPDPYEHTKDDDDWRDEPTIEHECTQGFALEILGCYIHYLSGYRNSLIEKIKKLGINAE